MPYRNAGSRALLRNGPFDVFLASQGILNLGDSFRFIAVTVLLYQLTGSGVSTALGLVFSALPSIILSPFAGALGDMLPEKYLLSIVDLVRGATALLFISEPDTTRIYLILVFLSALDMMYGPSRKKFVLNIAGRKNVMEANSLLTGVSGAAYLAGPLLAGVAIELKGPGFAFFVNSLSCLASSCLILLIRTGGSHADHNIRVHLGQADKGARIPGRQANHEARVAKRSRRSRRDILDEVAVGFNYLKGSKLVKEVVIVSAAISFCSISINMVFYPYAFDVLGVTSRGWSLIISVYYGTNLLAMLLAAPLARLTPARLWKLFFGGLAVTAVIWLSYGFTQNLLAVLVLQFIEGTVLAVCGILLVSRMQTVSDKSFIARVSGMSDILSSGARLAGIGSAFILMFSGSYKTVFAVNALLLLLLSLRGMAGPGTGRSPDRSGLESRL